ncbi:MAG: OmpA/MotB family protein [Chitinophagales bacterium]
MINFESDEGIGPIGLLDIMAALALIFILVAAIFLIDLRDQDYDISVLSQQKDSLQTADERRIIYLNSLEQEYLKMKEQSDSLSASNYLLIDSLSSSNMELIQELEKRKITKIIIPNELRGKVFFKSGQNKIEGKFQATLDEYVKMIKDSLVSGKYNLVQVEGHTDTDPVGKKNRQFDTNWELGAARALAVVEYFVSKGIDPQYLSATTHGEYKPEERKSSKAAKAKNRRIEIVLLKK